MPQFSHLHVHTQYSLLDGAASIPSLYKKAIADKMPALAITDHGNMFGAFEFVAEAYRASVPPAQHKDKTKEYILIGVIAGGAVGIAAGVAGAGHGHSSVSPSTP